MKTVSLDIEIAYKIETDDKHVEVLADSISK